MPRISEYITRLERLHVMSKKKTSNEVMNLLSNPYTVSDCQIFELVGPTEIDWEIDKGCPMSQKLFFVVKGDINFADGTKVERGKTFIVEAGQICKGVLSAGSRVILIAYPPDIVYGSITQHKENVTCQRC